jgi:hypothetical protein
MIENKGFDSKTILEYQNKMKALGTTYIENEEDERNDEYARFYFVGLYEGKEVIYDTVMYTLRLQHESELFEIAEHRAAQHFPEYRKISYEEDENGNLVALDPLQEEIGLYIAEVIMELEDEEAVKVREHVDLDVNTDFGVALDVGLHREKITAQDIEKFIRDFNEDTLNLDENMYSFQTEDYAQ